MLRLTSAFNLKLAPHLWAGAPGCISRRPRSPGSSSNTRVEYSLGANRLLHDLVAEDFPVEGGMIEVPNRPGLGITVRQDFLAKHTVAP